MSKTYQEFKNQVLGKAFDIDGYYGAQCWDGAMYYSQWLGYPVFHCWDGTGYAIDIWTARKTSGILNYYDEVSVLQPGDIVVFKQYPGWTPSSHIAIFDHDKGDGYGYFLGQNQGGAGGAFNLAMLPYAATCDTAFRPKCFTAAATKPTPIPVGAERSVYRLYNPNNSDHLYTTSNEEANNCQNAGWKYEGISWIYPNTGDAVWRLRNPNTTQHILTANETEKNSLVKAGWTNEGLKMRSNPNGKPIYRLYNSHNGVHLLTADTKEYSYLKNLGWTDEGIGLKY